MKANVITITNQGPLIEATNYWESALEEAGKLFLSPNAGAMRLLIPRVYRRIISDMRTAKYVICTVGPYPQFGATAAVELLFEDDSHSPFSLHLTDKSCSGLPGEPAEGQEWVVSVWDYKEGKPHKALERKCYWRAGQLPCLKPWKGELIETKDASGRERVEQPKQLSEPRVALDGQNRLRVCPICKKGLCRCN